MELPAFPLSLHPDHLSFAVFFPHRNSRKRLEVKSLRVLELRRIHLEIKTLVILNPRSLSAQVNSLNFPIVAGIQIISIDMTGPD